MNIRVIWHSIPEIGYYARTTTKGPEYEMVVRYIEYLVKQYSMRKQKKYIIFVEPQVDSCYPDIVIVEYKDYYDRSRKPTNHSLSNIDLKILMQIQDSNSISIDRLHSILGFSEIELKKSIRLLADCGYVHLSKTTEFVRKKTLKKWCRVQKITAIEAKIDKWKEAITQAEHNIWFATDSYIMLNKQMCSDMMYKQCIERGLGLLLVNGTIKKALSATKRKFPTSYASLQFNELLNRIDEWEEKLL